MKKLLLVTAFIATVWGVAPAAAETLKAGDVLEIKFTTKSPTCPSGPCDTLLVQWNEAGAFLATKETDVLYNGNVLLGTYFSQICCAGLFKSPTSIVGTNGAVVDFTAIDDGSINGILDLTIGTGFLTWPKRPTPSLFLGRATRQGVISGGTGIKITSVNIVPEPATMGLFIGGIGLLAVLRRKNGPFRTR
jgi:hypothetical protein